MPKTLLSIHIFVISLFLIDKPFNPQRRQLILLCLNVFISKREQEQEKKLKNNTLLRFMFVSYLRNKRQTHEPTWIYF